MFQYFQQLTKQNNPTSEPQSTDLRVAEKLTYQNYTKWCKLIQIAIEGRGRLNHIIGTHSLKLPTMKTTGLGCFIMDYSQYRLRSSESIS